VIYFVGKAQEWIIVPLFHILMNPVPPFTHGHIAKFHLLLFSPDLSFEYKKICEAVVLKMMARCDSRWSCSDEKSSKPKIFLAFLSKLLCFRFIL
jgi:hypothetical protein